MNVVDYILIALLLVFLVFGYRKGFLWQALSILAIAGSFFVAARFHAPLAESSTFGWLRERMNESSVLVLSFLLIFFVLSGFGASIAAGIGRKFAKPGLQPMNRWMGALLGTAKGAVILGGIAIALQQWLMPQGVVEPAGEQEGGSDLIAESVILPELVNGTLVLMDVVVDMIPPEDREEIVELYRKQGAGEPGEDEDEEPTDLPIEGQQLVEGNREEARDKEPAPVPRRRERLLDLGALRQLTAREREVPEEPEPARAREGDAAPR